MKPHNKLKSYIGQANMAEQASIPPSASHLRQPKKRFVGRRTAQAQKETGPDPKDVESTVIQKGKHLYFHRFLDKEIKI